MIGGALLLLVCCVALCMCCMRRRREQARIDERHTPLIFDGKSSSSEHNAEALADSGGASSTVYT